MSLSVKRADVSIIANDMIIPTQNHTKSKSVNHFRIGHKIKNIQRHPAKQKISQNGKQKENLTHFMTCFEGPVKGV